MGRKLQVGTTVGHWIIIDYDKSSKKYLCKCECGTERLVRPWSLNQRKSLSCGCKQKEKVGERIIESGFISIRKNIFRNYTMAANRRNYEFSLSFDEFDNLINKPCHYCGTEGSMTSEGTYRQGEPSVDYSMYRYNGVDRVDNNLGYTIENTVSCCNICNNSKSTLTLKEWREWLERAYLQMKEMKE